MSLTDELDLCDDGNILSNKEKLLKVGKLLGVDSNTCNEIPNNNWNTEDSKMEGRQLMRAKQIFKAFSDKIACLICPNKLTFHKDNDVKVTKVYQPLKENLTNLTFLVRKETPDTAASIITIPFEFNLAPECTEEQFSQLVE